LLQSEPREAVVDGGAGRLGRQAEAPVPRQQPIADVHFFQFVEILEPRKTDDLSTALEDTRPAAEAVLLIIGDRTAPQSLACLFEGDHAAVARVARDERIAHEAQKCLGVLLDKFAQPEAFGFHDQRARHESLGPCRDLGLAYPAPAGFRRATNRNGRGAGWQEREWLRTV